MKAKRCTLYLNTANGNIAEPIEFSSISKAVEYAKDSCYFAYRIFDENGKIIRRGFCD